MTLRSRDFESRASASSATAAYIVFTAVNQKTVRGVGLGNFWLPATSSPAQSSPTAAYRKSEENENKIS